MSDDQNDRFKYVNNDDPNQSITMSKGNDKNIMKNTVPDINIGIAGSLGWRQKQNPSMQNSRLKPQQISEEQKQKDRKIRKLTNVNKHLLQQLKDLNDQLTKRVNKQKFRIPKKSVPKIQPKNESNTKQVQGIKRQLQNSYRQIQYYKQTISLLKAKQLPANQKDKVNQVLGRLKQKNEEIQKLHQQIKTQKNIKLQQQKQLGKIQNQDFLDSIKKLDQEIKINKSKLKDIKKNFSKKEELEKKQRVYLVQLEALLKRSKKEQEDSLENDYLQKSQSQVQQQEISQAQWKQIKEKLAEQKKKYEQYGKKITYINYMKSKQSKSLQQMQLKYKQKAKILQKLKSKLNEVNKLARIRPKPQILQRVDLKMQKLKDIISRQSGADIPGLNKIKHRVFSQNVREFKKWQLQHAQRQNNTEMVSKQYTKNQEQSDSDLQEQYFSLNRNQLTA